MKELIRSNDLVEISWVMALLSDADIPARILDSNASVIEGSIGAIPRRIVVDDENLDEACRMLIEAGEAHTLKS